MFFLLHDCFLYVSSTTQNSDEVVMLFISDLRKEAFSFPTFLMMLLVAFSWMILYYAQVNFFFIKFLQNFSIKGVKSDCWVTFLYSVKMYVCQGTF